MIQINTTPDAADSAKNHMKNDANNSPKLYVGTYAKYNAGSLKGAWLDLSDYADRDEFLAACARLHSDESDPELMFQDKENLPECYYSESSAPADELWEVLHELPEHERLAFEAYAETKGRDDTCTVDDFRDCYAGTAASGADFAQDLAEELGEIPKNLPSWIMIDWEASWTCNLRHDYYTGTDSQGTLHFFRAC
jgi:antirestriction protein